MILGRRGFVQGVASFPLLSIVGCASQPKTPLAHLYGDNWVHGAYELYAGGYRDLQVSAETNSFDAYRVLAQKGVVSLAGLQTRNVPFFIKVNPDAKAFAVERQVPERLMFKADMDDKARKDATEGWNQAREHIHTDYEEIRRLNWSLTSLLSQLKTIRNAIENGREEQYKLVRQMGALGEGKTPPFELPYQVTPKDYEGVLVLLLERLEDDRTRLGAVESSIVTVGLTARATDANSGSLSANLQKVLLAVVRDADASQPRSKSYPQTPDDRAKFTEAGRKLSADIQATPEYQKWLKREQSKQFEAVGGLLAVLDQMTGLPTSAIYKQVLDVWRGDGDYLSYLKTAMSLIPGGGKVAAVIGDALEKTQKVRDAGQALMNGGGPDAVLGAAKKKGVGLLNTGSKYGMDRLDKQLSFFDSQSELEKVSSMLSETSLATLPLPKAGL